MKTSVISSLARWTWRGVTVLALLLSLTLAPAARAESSHSTITVYAVGAPAGAWVSVQWQDRRGSWHDVIGWQSAINMAEDSNLAFKQWGVEPEDYGRGPFRWVIYTEQGGSIWTTSSNFHLPNGDGASLTMTLAPRSARAFAGHSTITVHAPGAPASAWVSVQWQDQAGNWRNVDGWQSATDRMAESVLPFKQWGVQPKDYGRGPFRWVIYTEQGGAVWATSPKFNLPEGAGADLTMTLSSKVALVSADEMQTEALTLLAQASITSLSCGAEACDHSVISVYVPDAPARSRIGVQWQDGFGLWHDVQSWQGNLDVLESKPFKRWTINSNYGSGPFRWVIYNEFGDTVWGVSPKFTLPEQAGFDLSLFLSR